MIRRTLILLLVTAPSLNAFAQSSIWSSATEYKNTNVRKGQNFKLHLESWGMDSNYNHALAVGCRLNGDGWSGLVYYQRKVNRWQSHFFQFCLSEIKQEKQVKQERTNKAWPELGSGSPYVFGKINNLYTLQLGHGREFLLLPGLLEGNMNISMRMQAGLALAMLKPYYLKLAYVIYDTTGAVKTAVVQEEKYTDKNAEKFLNTGYIIGASKWGKGINEISYAPGGFADAAIVIEPLKNKTFIKTVTVGANFAFYSKELPIMAEQKARPYTATVFVGLNLGKRWK